MPSRGSPPPPCSPADPHRRPPVQQTPAAAMPPGRSPPPRCPAGDPYRRAALRAITTTALSGPPREIPAAALPSRKTPASREISSVKKQENLEGYYLLEDAEGYLFYEADGGLYFYECFKGEGYYYQSEESDYFHAGQSLYDKVHGLEALDSELQGFTLDADLQVAFGKREVQNKRSQAREEHSKGRQPREEHSKAPEASGVSGYRHFARPEPKEGV